MRNRWYRMFWTLLGARVMGESVSTPSGMPLSMARVLESPPPECGIGRVDLGEQTDRRAARYVYTTVWRTLREMGFQRPLRLEPWQGITLLVPFFNDKVCVIPQSFSERTPVSKRALAMIGKSAALRFSGMLLWVAAATWNNEVTDLLSRGGVNVCSLDRVRFILDGERGEGTLP